MPIILVVEDDQVMLKAIGSILNRGGFNVHNASNGKEALEMLDNLPYDIVITDLMMPVAGGLEVVNRIRSDSSKKDTGIIVMSSMGQEEMVTEAFNLGADDFLKKPVMPGELVSRIKKLLHTRNVNGRNMSENTFEEDVDDTDDENDPDFGNLPDQPRYTIAIHKFVDDYVSEPITDTVTEELLTLPHLRQEITELILPPEQNNTPMSRVEQKKPFARTYPEVIRVGDGTESADMPVHKTNRKTYYVIAIFVIITVLLAWLVLPRK